MINYSANLDNTQSYLQFNLTHEIKQVLKNIIGKTLNGTYHLGKRKNEK